MLVFDLSVSECLREQNNVGGLLTKYDTEEKKKRKGKSFALRGWGAAYILVCLHRVRGVSIEFHF